MLIWPKLRPTETLEPGKFYVFSDKVETVVLGAPHLEGGGSLGIFLSHGEHSQADYRLQRIDPTRCLEVSEGEIELHKPLKMETGRPSIRRGAIAVSSSAARLAMTYGDWGDLGWMDIETGHIETNELAFRHFFVGWSLIAPLAGDRWITLFSHQ